MTRCYTVLFLFFAGVSLPADEFFHAEIEPILSARCYQCHSHGEKMKAGLALDSRSGWEKGGDSGPAVIPGKPDESLLIRMVRWTDQDHQMPPKDQLPASEIALLEEWVKRGAPDPRVMEIEETDPLDWWSLRPLRAVAIPANVHPIDWFVRKRLAEDGISPAPEADRRTLMRRLSVNLHGVLPTPEEVDEFSKQAEPGAWEQLIDEMLASPRYGERWARHWLDVIHFADSHGAEHDVKRPHAWRFRDYVIDRLNADVSWARFIREQLAPDVFFPEEPELMAGLGFIAAGPLELSRAGTAPVTFDYLDRDDIVTQTMAAFTSTTANCARCHTHKFDPITQEDYYALQAVFAGVGKGDVEFDTTKEAMGKRQEMKAVLSAVGRQDPGVLLDPKYEEFVRTWVNLQGKKPAQWVSLAPGIFVASSGASLQKEEDGSTLSVSGPLLDQDHYTVSSEVGLDQLTAIRLEVLKDSGLPAGGPGRAANGNLHLSEVDLHWFPEGSGTSEKLTISDASADFDQDGWTAKQAIDGDPKTGWAIFPRVNESHFIVFELAKPLDVSGEGRLVVTLKQLYPPKHFIGRFRLSVTDAEKGAFGVLPKKVVAGLQKHPEQRSVADKVAIASAALKPWADQRLAELPPKAVVYGVSPFWSHAKKLEQPQKPKVVHLLRRGDIEQPIREVGPGSLAVLTELPARFELSESKGEEARRAALADWLAHPDNPLTWRSVVNRVWHFHFGKGLSDTPNDFGRMGSAPTHPELLDWLAVWFRDEAKGSLKQLHRLILTSETWRQSSRVAGNSLDSDNQFLWRTNRQRLDAETLRDSALRIAGKIDWRMGGPGIEQFQKSKGPQSTPALDYQKFDWNSEEARRRSIYRVVWRGIPDPFMESLDFPDLGLLPPGRSFSVSGLQSLSLYNNDFVLHASEWTAARLREEEAEEEHIRGAVQVFWQRDPTPDEEKRFESYCRSHGLAALCRVLLNSNEFLFLD